VKQAIVGYALIIAGLAFLILVGCAVFIGGIDHLIHACILSGLVLIALSMVVTCIAVVVFFIPGVRRTGGIN